MKTKTKGRRFLSTLLTLCMVIGLCVGFKTTAKAFDALPEAFSQLEGKANYDAATGAITLTDNVTLTTAILVPTGTYSIDLAGYTITSPANCIEINRDNVNLTLKDTSSERNGTLTAQYYAVLVNPRKNSNITIESGTYISTSTATNKYAAVSIDIKNGGSANISGGYFVSGGDALALRMMSDSQATLTGGSFKTSKTANGANSIGIYETTSRTISSIINASCHVSLAGADPVPLNEATALNATSYSESISIIDPTAVPTPDSDQESTIKATVIDNVQPPVSVPTYTTTIPAEINLGTLKKSNTESIKSAEFEVKVADVKNMNGKQVNVSISTTDGNFNLKKGTDTLPFKVFNKTTGGTALNSGNTFATFTEDKTVTGRVEVDQNDIIAAGNYSGTVKFSIALEDRVN